MPRTFDIVGYCCEPFCGKPLYREVKRCYNCSTVHYRFKQTGRILPTNETFEDKREWEGYLKQAGYKIGV